MSKDFSKNLDTSLGNKPTAEMMGESQQAPDGLRTSKRLSNARLVEMSLIHIGKTQPRKDFAPEKLDELKESIRRHGLLQPITVRAEADGSFLLITGERRFRACKELNLTEMPCLILQPTDDNDIYAKQLVENLIREDLGLLDKAYALLEYKEMLGPDCTWPTVEKQLGISESSRKEYVRVLSLPEDMQKDIVGDTKTTINLQHAKALSILRNEPEKQRELFDRITKVEIVSGEDAIKEAKLLRNANKPIVRKQRLVIEYIDDGDLLAQHRAKIEEINQKL